MNEYKIGDRVRIKNYEDISPENRSKGKARLCGKSGTIVDKLYSESSVEVVYRIQLDDYEQPSRVLWHEDCFIPDRKIVGYSYDIEILDNVVVVRFYEEEDALKTELARGHGHIIHEGAKGIAQATSYALKRIFEKLNGGSLGDDRYVSRNPYFKNLKRGGDYYEAD